MAYVIAEPCAGVEHGACVEVCPVGCIRPAAAVHQHVIDPEGCIDCGVCAAACPVEAIFPADEVPEAWGQFVDLNARQTRAAG
ncbi:MAG: ferredoxin family protein [Chloroflexota bacterium]|nr:ferredoxin family protein [Chloroflexota bacterium]